MKKFNSILCLFSLTVVVISLVLLLFNIGDKRHLEQIKETVVKVVNIEKDNYINLDSLKDKVDTVLYNKLENNKNLINQHKIEKGIDVTEYVDNLLSPWETVDEQGNPITLVPDTTLDYKVYKEDDKYYLNTEYLLNDVDTMLSLIENNGSVSILVGDEIVNIEVPEFYLLNARAKLLPTYTVDDIEEVFNEKSKGVYMVRLIKPIIEYEDSTLTDDTNILSETQETVTVYVYTNHNKITKLEETPKDL